LKWNASGKDPFALELQADVTNGAIVIGENNADQSPLRLPYEKLSLTSQTEPQALVSSLQLNSNKLGNAQINLSLDSKNPEDIIKGDITLQGLDVRLAKPKQMICHLA